LLNFYVLPDLASFFVFYSIVICA